MIIIYSPRAWGVQIIIMPSGIMISCTPLFHILRRAYDHHILSMRVGSTENHNAFRSGGFLYTAMSKGLMT